MHATASSACSCPPATGIDYRPAIAALRSLVTWGAAVARAHTAEPEDRDAIDRVERYVCARIGSRAHGAPPTQAEALTVAASLVDAFAIDFGAPALSSVVGQVYAALDWAMRSAGDHAAGQVRAHGLNALLTYALNRLPRSAPRVAFGGDAANDNVADLFRMVFG